MKIVPADCHKAKGRITYLHYVLDSTDEADVIFDQLRQLEELCRGLKTLQILYFGRLKYGSIKSTMQCSYRGVGMKKMQEKSEAAVSSTYPHEELQNKPSHDIAGPWPQDPYSPSLGPLIGFGAPYIGVSMPASYFSCIF